MDKGPWKAEVWQRLSGRIYVIQSDDFEHDVALEISGDFLPEDRMKYAEWLAALLTKACSQSDFPVSIKPGETTVYGSITSDDGEVNGR